MKRPPLLPILLVGLVGYVAYLAWDGRESKRSEKPFTLLERARALRIERPDDITLAHSMLTRALDQAPGRALEIELLTERAELREQTGAYNLARRDYERLIELEPDDLSLPQKLAGVLLRLNDTQGANAIWLDLLARQPGNGWFRSQAAQIDLDAWQLELDALEDELGTYLSATTLDELRPELLRLVHLPTPDPATSGILARFEPLLPEAAFEHLSLEAPRLRQMLADIRAEFAASLKGGANRYNVFTVLSSLSASGRFSNAVDFGLAALAFDASKQHPGTVQALALALNRLGRAKAATLAVNSVRDKDVEWYASFLDGWCDILYTGESWAQLYSAADLVRARAAQSPDNLSRTALAQYYKGIAAFETGRDEEAVQSLRAFIASRRAGPQVEARGRAFEACTTALERLGRDAEVLSMMRTWCDVAPQSSPRPWLFRADLAADDPGRSLAEANFLARAINAEPGLDEELRTRLLEATARGLEENAVDIPNMAFQSRQNERWYPSADVSPMVLFELAQHYLRRGEPAGAELTLARLTRDLPNFVPAYDERARAQLIMKHDLDYASALVSRLEISGPHGPTQDALRDLAGGLVGENLPGALLARWMHMDPAFTGAIEVARQLLDDGRDAEAFFTLNSVDRSRFTDADRLLYSQVLVRLERFDAILTATDPIGDKGGAWLQANVLRVLAAAKTNKPAALREALDHLEDLELTWTKGSDVDTNARLAFQALLESPHRAELERWADLLATTPGIRSGARMNQAALVAVLAEDFTQADDWLLRADGLSLDGAPLAGRLVLATLADDETRIARAVRDLRRESPAWFTLVTPAYLAGLELRFGEARAVLATELEKDPTDARIWLASAAIDAIAGVAPTSTEGAYTKLGDREPKLWLGPEAAARLPVIASAPKAVGRRILTLLLTADAPVWKAWTQDRVADKGLADLLGPFGTELQLDLALEAGRLSMPDLTRARQRFPSYIPFWDLFEDLTLDEVGRIDHPRMIAARSERRTASVPPRGGQPPTEVDLLLDESWSALDAGQVAVAYAKAVAAAQADPTSPAVQLNLARTAAAQDQGLVAQTAYLTYLLENALEREERSEVFGELVALGRPFTKQQLADLEAAYPNAPEPKLAATIRDMTQPDEINDALSTLERFANKSAALEDLSLGSSRAWFDMFLLYSADRALAFVDRQLEKNPRHVTTWIQKAAALDALGQRDAALELLRSTIEMSPDPAAAIALADLLADIGGPHEEVAATLNLARRSPDRADFEDLLEFIATKSLANNGDIYADQAIERMAKLLDKPELMGVERAQVHRRLGIVYLHRAKPGDGTRAIPHLEVAKAKPGDALDQDLLIALRNLAARLDGELAKLAEAQAKERAALEAEG